MEPTPNSVGEWITAEREARGWTKSHLAWRARLIGKDVTLYEQGKTLPTLEKYARIVKAFEDHPVTGRVRSERREKDRVLQELAELGLNSWSAYTEADLQELIGAPPPEPKSANRELVAS